MRCPPAKHPVRWHPVPSRRQPWLRAPASQLASQLASPLAWSHPSLNCCEKLNPDMASDPLGRKNAKPRIQFLLTGKFSQSTTQVRIAERVYAAGALSERHAARERPRDFFPADFALTRDKLMKIAAFAWAYGKFRDFKAWLEASEAWQAIKRLSNTARGIRLVAGAPDPSLYPLVLNQLPNCTRHQPSPEL